jgi:hypothetical protein
VPEVLLGTRQHRVQLRHAGRCTAACVVVAALGGGDPGGGIHVMSTNTSILVDSVGPPSAEVSRTAASFP